MWAGTNWLLPGGGTLGLRLMSLLGEENRDRHLALGVWVCGGPSCSPFLPAQAPGSQGVGEGTRIHRGRLKVA